MSCGLCTTEHAFSNMVLSSKARLLRGPSPFFLLKMKRSLKECSKKKTINCLLKIFWMDGKRTFYYSILNDFFLWKNSLLRSQSKSRNYTILIYSEVLL